jgi:ubiquinol-cytochrome c reductase iron-sulfur subunit
VFGLVGWSNVALGFTMGMSVLLIGTGAIQWAKKLMPDVEVAQERHAMTSPPSADREALQGYEEGKVESGFAQYKIIRRTLIAALALFPIPAIVLLRDLWPTPAGSPSPVELLSTTLWENGLRIVIDGTYVPIRPEDLPIGGLVSAVPSNLLEVEKGRAQLQCPRQSRDFPGSHGPGRYPHPAGRRLGLPGDFGLLKDLHP